MILELSVAGILLAGAGLSLPGFAVSRLLKRWDDDAPPSESTAIAPAKHGDEEVVASCSSEKVESCRSCWAPSTKHL